MRSVYCYCPTPRLESWEPFALSHDLLAPWVLEGLEEIASKAPYGEGRVNIGLAFDGTYLPREVVVPLFDKAKSLGVKVITTHYAGGAFSSKFSCVCTWVIYSQITSRWTIHSCDAGRLRST